MDSKRLVGLLVVAFFLFCGVAAFGQTATVTVTPLNSANQSLGFNCVVTPPSSAGGFDPLSATWNFGDGTTDSGFDPDTHTYTVSGTYAVTATVRGNDGIKYTGTTTVTVTLGGGGTTLTGSLTANPTSGTAGSTLFTFTPTLTGGTISSVSYNFGNGATATSTGSTTYTYPATTTAGSYTVTATITSTSGGTVIATTSVTVAAPNNAYILVTSPATGLQTAPAPATFFFNAFLASGTVASVNWDFGDPGSTNNAINGAGVSNVSHIFNTAGTYTITATVTGSNGNTYIATTTVTVTATQSSPNPAYITYNRTTPIPGQPFAFTAALASGTIATVTWDFGDGTNGIGISVTHPYPTGNFNVTAIITDTAGNIFIARGLRGIDNGLTPHVAIQLSGSWRPYGSTYSPVTYSTTVSSDATFTIYSASWNYGDGSTGVYANTNHTYNTAGNFTVTATVTPASGSAVTATVTIPVCSTPSGLTATAASSQQINLTWTDIANDETGFNILRSTNGTNYSQVAQVGAIFNYSDSGLSASTKYYYEVQAFNTAGASGNSSSANATTQAAPTSAPTPPTNLVATTLSSNEIYLTWTNNATNASNTLIERSTDNITFTQIGSVLAGVTNYIDLGLAALTTYYYRVRASNLAGNSGYSSATNAITQQAPSLATNSITVTSSSGTVSNNQTLSQSQLANFTVPPSSPTSGVTSGTTFPYGMASYNVTNLTAGASTQVTVVLPTALTAGSYQFYFYSLTTNKWTAVPANLLSTTDNQTFKITLTDGGFGDADGVANGVIVDPIGPGTVVTTTTTPGGGGGGGSAAGGSGGGSGGGGCGTLGLDAIALLGVACLIKRRHRKT